MNNPQLWCRSRDPKPPYASEKVTLHISEAAMTKAREMLFELPGHPFKSVQMLLRHAMAEGLTVMVDKGVPVDGLQTLLKLSETAEKALSEQTELNKLLTISQELLDGAQTKHQVEAAEKFVRYAVTVCKDPEIVARLEKLL